VSVATDKSPTDDPRQESQVVLDVSKNDAIVACSQTVTAVPFAVQRTDIACADGAEPRGRFQYAQGIVAINRAKLRLRFRRERKTHVYLSRSNFSTLWS
jgi:hypothetical protein